MTPEPRRRPLPFDLFAPGVIANPYPWYRMLRDSSPLHHVPERDIWVVSRFADVRAALLNHGAFSSADGIAYGRQSTSDMITSDPPEHTRMRKLVNRMFTPRAVALIEDRVLAIIDGLLDEIQQRGEADWVADVAVPLPITVIAEMLGIDVADRADFKRWSNSILAVIGGDHSPQDWALLDADRRECIEYLRAVIAERHRSPAPGTDLISVLLEASDGDQLSENEVLTFCMLLLVAGNETTTNAIGNGLLALHDHPDEMALLARDPSLINSAVEETLRYDAPIQGLFRTLRVDVTLPSGNLTAGSRVLLLYGSANRDSRNFDDAETFKVARNPTGHVAFGVGIHACVGAALARMELRALATEVDRRGLRILPAGQNQRSENTSTPLTRGLIAMPVVVI
jgi:cytochrome P450